MNTSPRRIAAAVAGLAAALAFPAAALAAPSTSPSTSPSTDGKGVIAVVYADQCDGKVRVGVPNILSEPVTVKVNGDKHIVTAGQVLVTTVTPETDGKVKVKIDQGPGQIASDRATHTYQRPAGCDKASASPSATPATSASASGPAATVDGGATPTPGDGSERPAALALTGRNEGQVAAVGAAAVLAGVGLFLFGRARFGRHRRSVLARSRA